MFSVAFEIERAEDLPKMDIGLGKCDPFVRVQVVSTVLETEVKKRTYDPVWNFKSVPFQLVCDSPIRITVLDHDRHSNEEICSFDVTLKDMIMKFQPDNASWNFASFAIDAPFELHPNKKEKKKHPKLFVKFHVTWPYEIVTWAGNFKYAWFQQKFSSIYAVGLQPPPPFQPLVQGGQGQLFNQPNEPNSPVSRALEVAQNVVPQGSSQVVLQNPNQPLRSTSNDELALIDRLRKLNISEYFLKRLLEMRAMNFDVVMLLDDSGSMTNRAGSGRSRWEELREITEIAIQIGCFLDENGVDVEFLNR